jgi:hypothetical protein
MSDQNIDPPRSDGATDESPPASAGGSGDDNRPPRPVAHYRDEQPEPFRRQRDFVSALTAGDAKRVVAVTCGLWLTALVALVPLRLDLPLTVSPEVMRAIAGSSLTVMSLAIAVLGLLHGFGWQDGVLRVLLLALAIVSAGNTVYSFLLSLAMPDHQSVHISGWVVFLVATAAISQLDWLTAGVYDMFARRIRGTTQHRMPIGRRPAARAADFARMSLLPILALALPLASGDQPAALPIILMMGLITNVVAIMMVATLKSVTDPANKPAARPIYQLKQEILAAIKALQEDMQMWLNLPAQRQTASRAGMVQTDVVVRKLRLQSIFDNNQRIQDALHELAAEDRIVLIEGLGVWIVPTDAEKLEFTTFLEKIPALVVPMSDPSTRGDDGAYVMEGVDFAPLRAYVRASYPSIPFEILDDYLLPLAGGVFRAREFNPAALKSQPPEYLPQSSDKLRLYIRADWQIPKDEGSWDSLLNNLPNAFSIEKPGPSGTTAILEFARTQGLVQPAEIPDDAAAWLATALMLHAPGWRETIEGHLVSVRSNFEKLGDQMPSEFWDIMNDLKVPEQHSQTEDISTP